MDDDNKRVGSGLHIPLKPGEELEIKGTDYIIRNIGSVSTRLHIFTKAYKRQLQREEFAARATAEQGVGYSKPKKS